MQETACQKPQRSVRFGGREVRKITVYARMDRWINKISKKTPMKKISRRKHRTCERKARRKAEILSRCLGTYMATGKPTAELRGVASSAPTLAAPTTEHRRRRWIIDSGSCFDLVNKADLTKGEKKQITEGSNYRLMTANGVVSVTKDVKLPLCSIDSSTRALVMEDSPSVLSLGKMCVDAGYEFVWKPGKNPHLKTPNGETVHLEVSDYVPVLAAPCLEEVEEENDPSDSERGGRKETSARGSLAAPASDDTLERAFLDAFPKRFEV